ATYGEQFQSSPDPKAGRHEEFDNASTTGRGVSILARPEGRAPRPSTSRSGSLSSSFNPRPTRRPGATSGSTPPSSTTRRFNPRPTRRPGATSSPASCLLSPLRFQSSPDPKAGRHVRGL